MWSLKSITPPYSGDFSPIPKIRLFQLLLSEFHLTTHEIRKDGSIERKNTEGFMPYDQSLWRLLADSQNQALPTTPVRISLHDTRDTKGWIHRAQQHRRVYALRPITLSQLHPANSQ
ncbi:hypothetical protein E3N88_42146 [Mikania micrantha]|uniref:Uncharacterized protein n=1 Tax=Mikania micrantha TaxID=192012 RepID=A0A5N6LIQ6_9ASTR|nr:hypothetical protein E3N88_42146 [Mikania micrantha]